MSHSDPEKTSPRRPTVVIVDDELIVTQSLSALLELETDYRVMAFQSPREALRALHQGPVDVVVSDFLMPEMNGIEFLREVRRMYPELPLLLLTGYADKENAIKGINEVNLFQYLEKPWDNERLVLAIRNGIAQKQLADRLSVKIRELDDALRHQQKLLADGDRIRHELEMARRLQVSMLPDKIPDVQGYRIYASYRPALDVGGDFYDAIDLGDGRVAVLIADITGHGIHAALSTALIKFAFSASAVDGSEPRDILAGMNEVLVRALPSSIFVGALVATVNRSSGACHLVNGGIPHPLLLKRRDHEVRRIPATGLLLGLSGGVSYEPGEEIECHLDNGDCLVLYTDGLSETENPHGERFEQGFLVEALLEGKDKRGEDILGHLERCANQFRQSDRNEDDITIIGIDSKTD